MNNWKDYRHRKIEDVPLYEDVEIEEIIIKKRRKTPSFSYGDISRNKVSA